MSNRLVRQTKPVWHVIDAKNEVVGRLAVQIARLLQGKNKPTYTPNQDSGDRIVVKNAKHLKFTGNKEKDKLFRWHTGYPGGLKSLDFRQLMERAPERVLQRAVQGMLPKNNLRKQKWMKNLKIYPDEYHPFEGEKRFSERHAPTYLETYKVKSKKHIREKQPIEGRSDFFEMAADAREEDLVPEDQQELSKKFVEQMVEALHEEKELWKAEGYERIPEKVKQLHDLEEYVDNHGEIQYRMKDLDGSGLVIDSANYAGKNSTEERDTEPR
eukprot:gb/GECG01011228.1/.p1 GENE.gb/GECG01011228.1/~~gb/GECG01011228.1/.p1  ORF type:complete len:270 (+),score=55.79 gb/GECG01011228.1/:1-810(+)